MLDELKKNIEQEKRIIQEMDYLATHIDSADEIEKRLYLSALESFKSQLRILNDSLPYLLEEPVKQKEQGKEKFVKLSYTAPKTKEKRLIIINKENKDKFIKELSLSESNLGNLKKIKQKKEEAGVKKPSILAKISNKIFSRISEKIAPAFSDLAQDLRGANIRFMIATYISIALFVSLSVFIISSATFASAYVINPGFIKWIWIPIALPIISLIFFYFYPPVEKGSFNKRISNELPFVTIYMAAIAGSNIEPVKIFKIISKSPEYPSVGLEIKKMIYQIEIYGYDLVNALKNSAKKTSSKRLAELFNGVATNIATGGSIKDYLGKKAENFLLDYKLERQRYTALAETLMDIYISILITAPLILIILIIIMNATKISIGLSFTSILILTLGGVIIVNIIFLIIIQLKQPVT